MFENAINAPVTMMPAALLCCENARPNTPIQKRGQRELPFSLAAIGELCRAQSSERIGGRDDNRVGQRSCDRNPLRQQQCRYPTGKSIIADHLQHLKHNQHQGALQIRRAKISVYRTDTVLNLVVERVWWRQHAPDLGLDPCLDHPHDAFGFFGAAFLREPTRQLR